MLLSLTRSLFRPLAQGPSRHTRSVVGRRWTPHLVTLAVAGGAVYFAEHQPDSLTALEGLKHSLILHNDSAAHSDSRPPSNANAFREDPETSIPFPVTLPLLTPSGPLTLVGLGVRKVSFLRVKVYSAGFYLEDAVLRGLHTTGEWHSFSASHLLTSATAVATDSDSRGPPQLAGEALMRAMLDQPVTCAVRIVPVRNTDFGHLRDGFIRALIARQKIARTNGELNEADETRLAASLQLLKSLFPAQSVPKGQSLILVRTSAGSLVVEYEGRVLGEVRDQWIAREIMLAYFADKDVISPKLKEDVAVGLEELTKR